MKAIQALRPTKGPYVSAVSLLFLTLLSPDTVIAQDNPTNAESTELNSTVVYDQTFFAHYPNAVSVLDIIRRIPAGQTILDSSGGSARGFSVNDDRILINGKRLTGKSNNSEDALGRITMDQVDHIEIIRGSSPDIKVTSSESIINIILITTANKGSGSWRATSTVIRNGEVGYGGFLSYGDRIGKLEYFASAELTRSRFETIQNEKNFDQGDIFFSQLNEAVDQKSDSFDLKANMTYTIDANNTLRLNGLYTDADNEFLTTGSRFNVVGESLVADGKARRIFTNDVPNWEVGGDFESKLSEKLKLKILGLYSSQDSDAFQAEDFLIVDNTIEDDFRFLSDTRATEAIGRAALTWKVADGHDLEIGNETSVNVLDVDLKLFQRENGGLVERDISASNLQVKETRNESFAIHTWKLSKKATLETQVFAEWSRISQQGQDVQRSRNFFFVRPSLDFRYNFNARSQLQVIARRQVQQLNFGDFAASVSEEDKIIEGNADLVPEKRWNLDTSFEHRLADDGGRIKATLQIIRYEDRISRTLIRLPGGPGDIGESGNGNIGSGWGGTFTLSGSFRMKSIGLPDLVLEPSITYRANKVTDPFTGLDRRLAFSRKINANFSFRHDITKWGLSYGGSVRHYSTTRFIDDIDQVINRTPHTFATFFVEKKLFGSLVIRAEGLNLANLDTGRDRVLFANGRTQPTTGRELREGHGGRRFSLNLRGTF